MAGGSRVFERGWGRAREGGSSLESKFEFIRQRKGRKVESRGNSIFRNMKLLKEFDEFWKNVYIYVMLGTKHV